MTPSLRTSSPNWICAPDSLLSLVPVIRNPHFPNAPYLYGRMYIRQHLRRMLNLDRLPRQALCSFSCENLFDVFVNGECVISQQRESGLVEISRYLHSGENLFLLRIYQTASPDVFTSAITGGLRMLFEDGSSQELLTDGQFASLWLSTFWETTEPEDFARNPLAGRVHPCYSGPWHPRALRRSLLFRKEFRISAGKNLRSARLICTAQGMALFSLDGEDLDDSVLQPGATEKRREYRCFELKDRLVAGLHVLGAITGNGWLNCHSWGSLYANRNGIFAALTLIYEDGSREEIKTDSTWLVTLSPLTDNDLQFGERYDANLEIPGWNHTGFLPDQHWMKATPLPEDELNKIPPLVEQSYPPIRPVQTWPLTGLRELPPGSFPAETPETRAWLFDVHRNIAGSIRLTMHHLRKGQKIGFYFCERLKTDGTPETGAYGAVVYYQDSLPQGIAPFNLRGFSQYIAAGHPTEYFSTRFTYTGFRYVILTGLSNSASVTLEAQELHTDLPVSGSFHSGSQALNTIWNATRQSWANNCHNGPTDCPTREKNFWNGDTQIFSHAACWISNVSSFLGNWTRYGRKMEPGVYGWEDETYVLPWTLYQFYGDTSVLRDCYDEMLALIERRQESPDMILPEKPCSPYNDWLNPTGVNLSSRFFASCWYLRMLDIVSRIAGILGDEKQRQRLLSRFNQGKTEFGRQFYDAENRHLREHIQCAYVLPLALGLVPETFVSSMQANLVSLVTQEGFQTTGFHGTRYLFDCLSEAGRGDLAIHLLERRDFPSWISMLEGLTSIPESWRGMKDPDSAISMSHFSYGACIEWFFEYLGGIRIDKSAPGLKRILLAPHAYRAIGSLDIRYQSPFGEIHSAWHYENGRAVFSYQVPEGMECTFSPQAD